MAIKLFGKLNIINNNKSKNSLTVMSVNLCYESDLKGISRVNYWFKKFIECHHKYGVNVIIMQEVLDDIINLPLLLVQKLKKWNVVLNNPEEHTLIITTLSINNKNQIIYKNKPIDIKSVHPTDIPSPYHCIYDIPYEGNPEINSMDELLNLCKESRMPTMKKCLTECKKSSYCIIGGDFNEPSHLDDELNIPWPLSTLLEKNKFIDSFFLSSKYKYK